MRTLFNQARYASLTLQCNIYIWYRVLRRWILTGVGGDVHAADQYLAQLEKLRSENITSEQWAFEHYSADSIELIYLSDERNGWAKNSVGSEFHRPLSGILLLHARRYLLLKPMY